MAGTIIWTAANAVLPVVLQILLGYFLKRINFFSPQFIRGGNKFVFKVLLPTVLFYNIYTLDGLKDISWSSAVFSVAAVTALFLIAIAISVATTKVNARRGVITQGIFRSNVNIVGLSMAGALGGDPAVSVVAVMSALTVPLYNVLAVISLSLFSPNEASGKQALRGTLKKVLRNPMIIGALVGFAFLLVRELQQTFFGSVVFSVQEDLPFLFKAISNVKSITTPFALLILGAEFEFSAIKGMFKEVAVGTFFRLVGAPLLGIVAAWLLSAHTGLVSFGPNEYAAFVALFGSPVAVSSVAMAEQMDGDTALATQLVVWTSVFSILTIFLQVCILMSIGLL
jgi:predicted permease